MLIERSGMARAAVTAAVVLATVTLAGLPGGARAETIMRIGMTAADIPRTLGQPDQEIGRAHV